MVLALAMLREMMFMRTRSAAIPEAGACIPANSLSIPLMVMVRWPSRR